MSWDLKGILIVMLLVRLTGFSQAENIHFSATNLWQLPLGRYCKSSPAMDAAGLIYITCLDGRLFAVNPDGSKGKAVTHGYKIPEGVKK